MIIGKLIPAGTGMPLYRDIKTVAPDYEPLAFYTSEAEDEMDLATWLREASTPRETAPDFGILADATPAAAEPEAEIPVPVAENTEFTDAINALENLDRGRGEPAANDQPGEATAGE